LSGRGLCDELITRPEESYRLCCVVVYDLETSRIGAPYIYDISRLRVNTAAGIYALRLGSRFSVAAVGRDLSFLYISETACGFHTFSSLMFTGNFSARVKWLEPNLTALVYLLPSLKFVDTTLRSPTIHRGNVVNYGACLHLLSL